MIIGCGRSYNPTQRRGNHSEKNQAIMTIMATLTRLLYDDNNNDGDNCNKQMLIAMVTMVKTINQ